MNDCELHIIIPTFNRSERVSHLLGLISYAAENPLIQITVVDDCSTKVHRNHLTHLKNNLPNIDFIFLPHNSGGAGARNKGAFSRPAKWLWFIDDDDLVDSKTVLGVLDSLRANPDHLLYFVKTEIHYHDSVKTIIPQTSNLFDLYSRHGNDINTSCSIFSFKLFKDIGGWDSNLVAGQDADLLLRASEHTDGFLIENFKVKVVIHNDERITSNPRKQMVGKLQFIKKHHSRLHPLRLSRYVLTTMIFYPYIRRVLKR